ncbi:15347_t:CDS:2, partial [Acaulospora colombiana]
LLEDHLNQRKAEEGLDADMVENSGDERGWEGWDIDSDDSSEEESENGWINVESDGEEAFDMSDSEDDSAKKAALSETVQQNDTPILTPADFALLQELRLKEAQKAVEMGGGSQSKRKLALLEAQKKATAMVVDDHDGEVITEATILGPRKKAKASYEERMASIAKGREGREKFGSYKGKKRKAALSSSTNREKSRNKPVMMVRQSSAVRAKKMAGLKDKQKRIRAHIERAKKAYH